jgi:hypothetical protein
MIHQVESQISWAIIEMEKENASGIEGTVEMGDGKRYYYQIKKIEEKIVK